MHSRNPDHIGIILDGNRRWARARKMPTFFGHQKGLDNLRTISTYAFDSGVKYITVFAFSTENWKRSKKEVSYLMSLFKSYLQKNVDELVEKGIRLRIIGKVSELDRKLQDLIKSAEKRTAKGNKGTLNVCINYGGHLEIVEAVRKLNKSKKKITIESITKNTWLSDSPFPDLIIRTSGEQRLSGFLTWQSIYSELYFSNKPWPGFTKKDLDMAIKEYNRRQRRFGGN